MAYAFTSPDASTLLGAQENEYSSPWPRPGMWASASLPLHTAVSLAAAMPGRARAATAAAATASAAVRPCDRRPERDDSLGLITEELLTDRLQPSNDRGRDSGSEGTFGCLRPCY